MRAAMVVIVAPGCDGRPRLGQAQEYMVVKAFVAQAAVEGFDEGILQGLARRDVVPVLDFIGVPDGIRTRVTGVKGRCPRPG